MYLIGLSGAIGAGKDTVADILQEIDNSWVRLDFKAPIVHSLVEIFDLDCADIFYDRELKETPTGGLMGHTPRYVMQTFGTDFIRDKIHKDFFAIKMENNLRELLPRYNVVITDVRFANEAEMIKRNGGVILHIVRPNNPYTCSNHPSEQQNIQQFADGTIINEGENLDSFKRIIKSVYAGITNRVDANYINR